MNCPACKGAMVGGVNVGKKGWRRFACPACTDRIVVFVKDRTPKVSRPNTASDVRAMLERLEKKIHTERGA